jgi:hypothetical protein
MKKLLLVFLLLIPLAIATCPENLDDCDYDSRQVNDLNPVDLATAIYQGRISDLTLIDNSNLAEALKSNPSIAYTSLANRHLTRAVSFDLSLIDNAEIFNEIDRRAQEDVFILNDNPDIKKAWFESMSLVDQGVEILSYDGEHIETTRKDDPNKRVVVKFSLKQHNEEFISKFEGATFLETGELVLKDGTKFGSGVELGIGDRLEYLEVTGGHTDLTDTDRSSGLFISLVGSRDKRGTVQIGNRIFYSSDSETQVDFKIGRPISIRGNNVYDKPVGISDGYFRFSGEVRLFEDGHRELIKGTRYRSYSSFSEGSNSHSQRDYKVDGLTEFYPISASSPYRFRCDGSKNCIQEDVSGRNVGIVSKNGNRIEVTTDTKDSGIDTLKILNPLMGSSEVIFRGTHDGDGFDPDITDFEMRFSKNPTTVEGDINKLNARVEHLIVDFFAPEGESDSIEVFYSENGITRTRNEFIEEDYDDFGEYKPGLPPIGNYERRLAIMEDYDNQNYGDDEMKYLVSMRAPRSEKAHAYHLIYNLRLDPGDVIADIEEQYKDMEISDFGDDLLKYPESVIEKVDMVDSLDVPPSARAKAYFQIFNSDLDSDTLIGDLIEEYGDPALPDGNNDYEWNGQVYESSLINAILSQIPEAYEFLPLNRWVSFTTKQQEEGIY